MLPAALTVIVLLVALVALLFWNLALARRIEAIETGIAHIGPDLDALKKRTGI